MGHFSEVNLSEVTFLVTFLKACTLFGSHFRLDLMANCCIKQEYTNPLSLQTLHTFSEETRKSARIWPSCVTVAQWQADVKSSVIIDEMSSMMVHCLNNGNKDYSLSLWSLVQMRWLCDKDHPLAKLGDADPFITCLVSAFTQIMWLAE